MPSSGQKIYSEFSVIMFWIHSEQKVWPQVGNSQGILLLWL